MPEKSNDRTIFTLLEVTASIQKTLNERYTSSFWVKAEMNKLNLYRHSGHCYPELVEKSEGKIIAQIRSVLWRTDFERVNQNFQTILKEPLKDGIKILFLAKINFDPIHGMSLTVLDIDPAYTLGDLEKEKQDTINQLRTEGLFDRNKYLQLPLLPQRIAIISVETSKGYADFINVIEKNTWGYKFFQMLFPALLQGDKAAADIVSQLRKIQSVVHHFDVVAIIRGGGGDVGLSCYNDYQLAKAISTFPIPVITGIGHSTNETVSEMISFANAITPTKLAEYLIQKFHNFSVPVKDAENKIIDKGKRLLLEEKTKFQSEIKLFRSVTENILSTNRNELKNLSKCLFQETQFRFRAQRETLQSYRMALAKDCWHTLKQLDAKLDQSQESLKSIGISRIKTSRIELFNLEKQINNMSPANVLRRGYSITLLNGKVISDVKQVKKGDTISTTLFEGNIHSIVESTDKKSIS